MNKYLEKSCTDFNDKLGFYLGRRFSEPVIPPEHVYFSLTNRCNLNCRMCEVGRNPSRQEEELKTSEIKGIVLQIGEMGIKHLIFSGGEPLLRPDLMEILEFSVAQGIPMVDMITNGTLLEDCLAEKLVLSGINHITISLDGLREANNAIRGKGVFEKASASIDRINAFKHKHSCLYPSVGINFTIMDSNIDDILPMVDFARSKKCNVVVFQPVLFSNIKMYEKSRNALWVSAENSLKLKQAVGKLVGLKRRRHGPYIYTDTDVLEALPGYFNGESPGGDFKCYEGIKRIVITCAGTLWNCLGVYGDLRRQKLKDAWFSAEARQLRRKNKDCREHCLQDCVYFPSDINSELSGVLSKIKQAPWIERKVLKCVLLRRLDAYLKLLSDGNDPGGSERENLKVMKKKISRAGRPFSWW